MAMKPEDFDRLVNKIINEDWYDETDWSAKGKKDDDGASESLNDEEDFKEIQWEEGDTLRIRSRHSGAGKGLNYDDCIVKALKDGFSGGWDVYDGIDVSTKEEVSFYGFSVESKINYCLKTDLTFYWGEINKREAHFAAGTPCVRASNQPDDKFWIDGEPTSFTGNDLDFSSWMEAYGFLVDRDEVEPCTQYNQGKGSKISEGSEGGSGEMEKKIEYALDSIERMADVQHMVKGTRFGLGLDQSVLNMPVKGTSRTLGEQITFCYNGIRTLKNLVKRGESAQQISNRMNDSVFKDMYWPIGADEEGVDSFLEAIEEGLVKYGASPDDIKKMIWHLNWAIEGANRNLSSICESCGPIKEGDEGDEEEENKNLECEDCGRKGPLRYDRKRRMGVCDDCYETQYEGRGRGIREGDEGDEEEEEEEEEENKNSECADCGRKGLLRYARKGLLRYDIKRGVCDDCYETQY